MALKDIFKFKEKKTISSREIGSPGTEIFSGYITEEFNSDLRDNQGAKMFDRMRKTDAQVFASLQAMKLPLLSARWFIQPAENDDISESEAQEQADFISENLFNKLKWKKQLHLILTFLDFGYKYFEKVFGVDEDGKIVWAKWGDRQQTAHSRWANDAGTVGAQQQLSDMNAKDDQPFTPMEKLILFSYRREGNNYEGVSILRTAYKHWWFKDTLYRIQGIQAERYGVGLPWVKMGDSNSADDRAKAEEMGKNLRSNETSFWATPSDWEAEILTPGTNSVSAGIESAINHHNRMILVNILAQFLDLGSDATGSFALSKEQGSFFLLSLQAIADNIKDVVNDAIEELILLNWPETKKFPKLEVTDISNVDGEIFANMMNTLTVAGYLKADVDLKKFVRNTLKLPEMTKEEEEAVDEEDDDVIIDPKISPEEIEEKLKKNPKKEEEEKKKLTDKLIIMGREKQYLADIDNNEKIIEVDYKGFEEELIKTEATIKKFLHNKIDKADKKSVNGVDSIKRSFKLVNEVKSGINDIMKKFNRKVSGGVLSNRIMKDVAKNAIISSARLKDTKDFASTLIIAAPQIRSFMAGHISNMHGVTFNEGRQTFESMQENISQEVSVRLAKKQIDQIKFNRNIFMLSVTAHPRGLFRSIVADDAKERGINHFKMVIPPSKKASLSPSGSIAKWLFLILTLQQWNERTGTKSNINTVGGIGAHHNSMEYYYPVDEDNLNEEQALAKEQRAEFNKEIK